MNGKEKYLSGCQVLVDPRAYSVLEVGEVPKDYFAVVCHNGKTTVVTSKEPGDQRTVFRSEPGWRLLTFDLILPFTVVGFLAKVSTALAEAGVSIFVMSSFDTDHLLVKDESLSTALKVLTKMGAEISP